MLASLLIASCGDSGGEAAWTDADCVRIAIRDAATGKSVVGIEDMDHDPSGDGVFLSAYDRIAVERAVDNGEAPPSGGLYHLPMGVLGEPPAEIALDNLAAALGSDRDFHPHGMAVLATGPDAGLLAVLNRRYDIDDAASPGADMVTVLELFAIEGATISHRHAVRHPLLCNGNDLAFLNPDELVFTRDHDRCTQVGRALEDAAGAFGFGSGQVVLLNIAVPSDPQARLLADGLGFANGVAIDRKNGRLAVAATTDSVVHIFDLTDTPTARRLSPIARLPTPGGPDNLTYDAEGILLAAVHPSLWRLGLYRYGFRDQAPSRLVAVHPDGGTRLLWDHDGSLISGATVGLAGPPGIVLGSVRDGGIALCGGPKS